MLPAAGAIEMVHTASLILDDLPCMDDATLRRGRPTCHVAHGEATAILAAFALQNRAFEILGEGWPGGPDAAVRAGLTRELALAIGLDGMIAGQATDLEMTDRVFDFQTLEFIHSRKTGALFTASAELGGGRGPGERGRARRGLGLREEPGAGFPGAGRSHRRDRGRAGSGQGRGPGPEEDDVRLLLGGERCVGAGARAGGRERRGAPRVRCEGGSASGPGALRGHAAELKEGKESNGQVPGVRGGPRA